MTVHPSMALTGRSAPNAQRGWEPGLVTPKSPSSIHLLRNQERQKAFVLIVGAGKASHWASLWMFAVSGRSLCGRADCSRKRDGVSLE